MPLESIVSLCNTDGIAMLNDMLQWNPARRPTALQSLKYNYFKVSQKLGPQQINNLTAKTTLNQNKSLTNYSEKTAPNPIENDNNINGRLKNIYNGSPNVDNDSIQQLQQQIGTHASRTSTNSLLKSGLSVKDQYLAKSRYIAGQNTKNASYRNSGESRFCLSSIWKY
jgi:hypothetical protein